MHAHISETPTEGGIFLALGVNPEDVTPRGQREWLVATHAGIHPYPCCEGGEEGWKAALTRISTGWGEWG